VSQAPRYKLTEEVVRQSVEVLFGEDSRWQIAFTNPTAGPWKKIQLGQYVGGADLRFTKEEDRPDLILFCALQQVLLVLEAKSNIQGLLGARTVSSTLTYPQLEKSVEVFAKEFRRFDAIMSDRQIAARVMNGKTINGSFTLICGYVYSEGGPNFVQQQERLHQVHTRLASVQQDPRLPPSIDIVVAQQPSQDLAAHATLIDGNEALEELIRASLPVGLPLR